MNTKTIANITSSIETGKSFILLALVFLLLSAVFFGIGGKDDSYITYWSAHTLAEFGEITNFNGDRIEQSSSLLHVILLAGLFRITHIPIPTLGIIFSVACGLATAIIAGNLAHKLEFKFYKATPFLIIFSTYFSYWSSSGMETSLAALTIILFIIAIRAYLIPVMATKNIYLAGCAIALYILVRPEGFLILIAFFFLILAIGIFPNTPNNKILPPIRIIQLIAITAALFAALAAWRYSYFGQIFPQPVYAKTDLVNTYARLHSGMRYLAGSLNFSTAVLVVLCITGLVTKRKQIFRSGAVLCVAFLLAFLSFVACSGGDWMEARRLIVPVIPIVCILAIGAISTKRQGLIILPIFFSMALFDFYKLSQTESTGFPLAKALTFSYVAGQTQPDDDWLAPNDFSMADALNYAHLRDRLAIPKMDQLVTKLIDGKTEPVYLISRQMGMVPYYLSLKHYKQIHFIDMRGITTKDIFNCKTLTASKPRSTSGILISSKFYLGNITEIDADCFFPPVDIIYDVSLIDNSVLSTQELLASAGFDSYYLQTSKYGDHFWFFVGVRRETMRLLQ